jgi:hypothetical protein
MTSSLEAESHRRKADALLREASAATNMAERGRLIDEAGVWHFKALAAAGLATEPTPDPALTAFLDLEDEPESPQA